MKQTKNRFLLGSLLLMIFAVVSVFTFYQSNQLIEKGYLASEGKAAENFAVLAASNIHLTDEQVRWLKQCSYAELLESEENESLRKMMDNDHFASKVDYAYVMVHLKRSEVKYQITAEDQDLFDAPLGTNLDILWLLDVNVSPESEAIKNERAEGNAEDINRYSYYIDEDVVIFGEAPTYLFNASEWGDHICGYAPLYTVEGSYIGVLGVELQTNDFNAYRVSAMRAMGILLFVSTFTLMLLFAVFYVRYRKAQYTRIYTDSLTKISNRSYYNDLFIKHMNAEHPRGACFALLIADIDWFKQVNDTFGHEIGDQVLLEIGEILMKAFGKSHVVRFGGEEFVVGLWLKDEAELLTQMELLFQTMREHKFSRQQIDVSLSLGGSYGEPAELNGWLLSGMLKAADRKLYQAKGSGRGRYLLEKYAESNGNPEKDENT